MKFSANLGFLWADIPLPDAIRAAKDAGFDAVECHWPYEIPAQDVAAALQDTGLEMLGLNTRRGDISAGENGLSAVPGRDVDARMAIDEALAYAAETGTHNIHVMAGNAEGNEALQCFLSSLDYACRAAEPLGITILIEPMNRYDAPGYFLRTTGQAMDIIGSINAPNLKLMFDCYHVARTEGEVTKRLDQCLDRIGHIQFASVPDRGAPDHGDLDYSDVFAHIAGLGYHQPLGAEYKPGGPVHDSLGWMDVMRPKA